MHTTVHDADVVIIGGGIAGGSLATVLARHDLDVIVLERDTEYRDRNKGENMMPWGWAEVVRLGLEGVFTAAAGFPNPAWVASGPSGEAITIPVADFHPAAQGSFSVGHVAARQSLARAATDAGADVRFGVSNTALSEDPTAAVAWEEDGQHHRARAHTVIGADGRGSRTRRQSGLSLQRGTRTHVVSSVLVSGVDTPNDNVLVSTGGGRLSLTIPLDAHHARLYLVTREERFTGRRDAEAMIDACRQTNRHDPTHLDSALPVGPCATYSGHDAWIDDPVTDDVVLVGDAGGYNSPIIGQGLSLAMRDVRLVADTLLQSPHPGRATFTGYVTERRERLRRVRFFAQLWADLRLVPDHEVASATEHPELMAILPGMFAGFDDAPAEWFTDDNRRRLLALRGSRPVGAGVGG